MLPHLKNNQQNLQISLNHLKPHRHSQLPLVLQLPGQWSRHRPCQPGEKWTNVTPTSCIEVPRAEYGCLVVKVIAGTLSSSGFLTSAASLFVAIHTFLFSSVRRILTPISIINWAPKYRPNVSHDYFHHLSTRKLSRRTMKVQRCFCCQKTHWNCWCVIK